MKKINKTISIAASALLVFLTLAPASYAAVNNGGLSGGCNTITDCGADDFYGGACKPHIATLDDCNVGPGWDQVTFSCSSGCSGSCQPGFIRCGSACVSPEADDGDVGPGDGVVDGLTCGQANLGFNTCTGQCGSCTAGYELINGKCTSLADVEARVTVNEDNIAFILSILAALLGVEIEDDDENGVITIEEIVQSFLDEMNLGGLTIEEIIDNLETHIQTIIDEALANFQASGTVWVGLTPGTYDGNDAGSYAGADAYCDAVEAGAKVCSVEEILALERAGDLAAVSGKAWINGGPPGFNAAANDCKGWQSDETTAQNAWGRYWNFDNDAGWADACNLTHEYACCK